MDGLPFAGTSNGADTNPMEVDRGAGAAKEDPELERLLTVAQGEDTGPDLGKLFMIISRVFYHWHSRPLILLYDNQGIRRVGFLGLCN